MRAERTLAKGQYSPSVRAISSQLTMFTRMSGASLSWLVRWLQQGRLHYFAWWLLALGPAVVLWQLWGTIVPK